MAVSPIHHRGNIYFFIHIGEYYSDIGPDRISKTPRLEKLKRRIAVHEKIRVPPVPVLRFLAVANRKDDGLIKVAKRHAEGSINARNGDFLHNNTL